MILLISILIRLKTIFFKVYAFVSLIIKELVCMNHLLIVGMYVFYLFYLNYAKMCAGNYSYLRVWIREIEIDRTVCFIHR